jgi:actin-like ATPase involved in cell morphogenesis
MTRTEQQIRTELEAEREQLAGAVESLRTSIQTDVKKKMPLLAAGAASVGFVLAGGIGATMRYFARRGREH